VSNVRDPVCDSAEIARGSRGDCGGICGDRAGVGLRAIGHRPWAIGWRAAGLGGGSGVFGAFAPSAEKTRPQHFPRRAAEARSEPMADGRWPMADGRWPAPRHFRRERAGRSAMEPGGIEPPCRSSQQDASTRVADDLRSVRPRPRQARFVPRPQWNLVGVPGDPHADQPEVFDSQAVGPQARESCDHQLGRESVAVIGSCFLHAFYLACMLQDAPHQASHARSKPYRPRSNGGV